MTACEECWAEASWRAAIKGGVAADHYRDVLAESPDGHPAKQAATTRETPTEGLAREQEEL